MGRISQAMVGEAPAAREALRGGSGPGWRLAAAGFPLATLMVVLLGVLLVYVFFVRPDAFNEWFAFKPGILADMTSDSGKLQVQPYRETLYWYEWSANFHSSRWADTLLFLGLRDVTGLELRQLSIAPFGIAVYLVALLFVFLSADRGAAGRLGFLLSALLLLFAWPMLGWVFHSGGWPGTAMGLLCFGLLFQASRGRHQVWFRGMAILFLFLAFGYYQAMAVLLAFLLPTLFAYQGLVFLLSRLRSHSAPAPAFSYFNLAIIAVAWFFLDPLFSFLVGETGVTRPWEGMQNFYASIFERAGDVVPYQRGYSLAGRIMLMLPLVALFLAAAWFWARDQLPALIRGRSLSEGQVISGAFFLTAPLLSAGAVVAGAGAFRYAEVYYLLLLAAPLLMMQWLFSRPRLTRLRVAEAGAVAASLLAVTLVSFAVLASEPISGWGHLQRSDVSAAAWAAQRIDRPYFADNFTSGLILLENRKSPIVPLQVSRDDTAEVLYSGADNLAESWRAAGAALALLSGRSVEAAPGEQDYRTLKTTDFFIQPIPDYDFGVEPYGQVYDDGRNTVITLGTPSAGRHGPAAGGGQ